MNLTNPYWTPKPIFSTGTKGQKSFANNLGFFFKLPVADIQTSGYYFGENPIPDRRELVFRSEPEYYAVDGKVPSSGGLPKYDPRDPMYAFKRSDYTKKF